MKKRSVGAVVGVAALLVTVPAPAFAHQTQHQSPHIRTVNTTVAAPFNLALNKGHVYVADGGTSTVSRLTAGGQLRTVASGPQPGEVAGLDLTSNGRYLAYTSTNYGTGATALNIAGPRGSRRSVDLSAYEQTKNPDGHVSYGVRNPSECVKQAIESIPDGPPVSYRGIVDSHPYSVASVGRRGWIVADAAGNDLLRVGNDGHISTLTVLPRQPVTFTAAMVAAMHLPACVIGVTYNFEPVPTDVEVGRDGWLYVSTLAGGPEDGSLGARSSVYRVNPRNGHATRIASGLGGATNLAVGRDGRIYVAELFAGRVSVIKHGVRRTYVMLPNALSIESGPHGFWAGTLGGEHSQGSIVTIS